MPTTQEVDEHKSKLVEGYFIENINISAHPLPWSKAGVRELVIPRCSTAYKASETMQRHVQFGYTSKPVQASWLVMI